MQEILTYIIILLACIYATRRIYTILTQKKCQGCSNNCKACDKKQIVKENNKQIQQDGIW